MPDRAGPDGAAHERTTRPDGASGGPVDEAAVRIAELLMIKPKWRGWIHTVTAPLAFAAGLVLVLLAPTAELKIASRGVRLHRACCCSASAPSTTAATGPPASRCVLKRLDHTNIMLVIAGSYTPLAWALLDRPKAVLLLWVIWSGRRAGGAASGCSGPTPRAGSTCRSTSPWAAAALFYLPDFFAASVPAAVLICVGGALYIAGAVFYALKKPNFSYEHFGFHELFHAFTVFAFAAHYIAIAIAVLG